MKKSGMGRIKLLRSFMGGKGVQRKAYFAELEVVVTCAQNEETRLNPCWPGCAVPCLERLQHLYDRNATAQAPRSTRAKSVYNAVWASTAPNARPRN